MKCFRNRSPFFVNLLSRFWHLGAFFFLQSVNMHKLLLWVYLPYTVQLSSICIIIFIFFVVVYNLDFCISYVFLGPWILFALVHSVFFFLNTFKIFLLPPCRAIHFIHEPDILDQTTSSTTFTNKTLQMNYP